MSEDSNAKDNSGNGSKSFKERPKRFESYWEPIYEPDMERLSRKFNWSTKKITEIKNNICDSKSFDEVFENSKAKGWSIKSFRFERCDFSGHFNKSLTFRDCIFELCDLGYTTWEGTKFTGCRFKKCSFTLAVFKSCQFINCEWQDSGISSTETKLFSTLITKPYDFISSGYTNLDVKVLKEAGDVSATYQKMRLEKTKMRLARAVLSNNEEKGDDSVYFESVKVYMLQMIKAKKEKLKHDRRTGSGLIKSFIKLPLYFFEECLIKSSGALNGWGGDLARAASIGVTIIALFSIVYFLAPGQDPSVCYKTALIKSFDITLLFGYTKHSLLDVKWFYQLLYVLNALMGLWWYAIFVPTVINRVCRVR